MAVAAAAAAAFVFKRMSSLACSVGAPLACWVQAGGL
jgi:hypothetical protein